MKRITTKEFRQLILEVLGEPDELVNMDSASKAVRLSKKSVDDQIDAYILKAENESISTTSSSLEESLSSLSLSALLNEQEEEAEEEFPEEEAGDEGGEGEEEALGDVDPEISDPEGSEAMDVEEPPAAVAKPPINLDEFAKKMARLSMNYNAQLDIPTVIVNRALNFLKENYDENHVKKMIEVLNSEFDFNIGMDLDRPSPPAALGAFGEPEGLPATGGGGDV
jgi:hypothetical protein